MRSGAETAGLVLDEYEHILRAATEEAGGRVLEVAGDSVIAAFVRATGCSDNCRSSRNGGVRRRRTGRKRDAPGVKIGLHTGEASPTKARYARYIGLTLPRAFRVCGGCFGLGRSCCRSRPRACSTHRPSDSFVIRDLGTRQLDDFDRPVRLYELVI